MAITSYPFDGQEVSEAEYSRLFSEFSGTGVAATADGAALAVSANASGMRVFVAPGFAVVRGHAFRSTEQEELEIEPSGTQVRYDLVVLELDPSNNEIRLTVLTGTPGGEEPALTQTEEGVYHFPLATVTVPAGAVTIAAGNVTDRRAFLSNRVGVWRTATRPESPRLGQLGYNTDTDEYEHWNGSSWQPVQPTINWSDLANRPSTFTPSAHTHKWTDITDRPTSMPPTAHNHLWEQILDKPTSYPPTQHSHTWDSITSKPSTFPPASHSHAWSTITGKPSAFPPASHTHSGSDITSQVQNSIYAKRSDEADGTRMAHSQNATGPGPWYSVWVNADRQFMRNTSSRRFKENIKDHHIDPKAVLALRPRMYDRIGENTPKDEYGLIAEEVYEHVPEIVIKDEEGRIDSVRYDLVAVALLEVVKDQERRIAELEARLT